MTQDRDLKQELLTELDAIAREQASIGPRDHDGLEALRRRVDRVRDQVQRTRRGGGRDHDL